MTGKLLARQLKRAFGVADEQQKAALFSELAQGRMPADFTPRLQHFLTMVDEAYAQFERDLALRSRSLALSSKELMEANERLRDDFSSQQRVIESLRNAAHSLIERVGGAAIPEPLSSPGDDIETLSQLVTRLIAERQQAEIGLKESEERLNLALEAADDGLWDWNPQTGAVYFSERWKRMLGYQAHEIENHADVFARLTHPQDLERIRPALAAHLAGTTPSYSAEFRMLCKDGSWLWIRSAGKVVERDEQGKPTRMVGTHHDITERKQTEMALLRAKSVAEAANRAKSDFLANMSHEIRTPMNGIIGMTDLALDTRLDAEQRGYLNIVRTSALNLLTIVNDILDFSKIEAGRLDIEQTGFSLGDMLGDVLKTVELRAHEQGLELVGVLDKDLEGEWLGDPVRLRQVLLNLIGNAIKFTPQGEVEVRIEHREDELLHFAVRDSGIGIASDKQALIFEAFSQADSSTTREFGGTGLGLTISRRLVALMGGQLKVNSEPGFGSTFSFALPLQKLAPLSVDPVDVTAWQGMRVMVVDDNAAARYSLVEALNGLGAQPRALFSGREAHAALILGEYFDLALVDTTLPEEDSMALARALLGSGKVARVALLVTAVHGRDGSHRSFGDEHIDYLLKPVLPADLRAYLKHLREAPPPGPESAPASLPKTHPEPGQPVRRVLLAEDNTVNQLLAIRLLEKQGCEVVVVENGRDAVIRSAEMKFDAVLMDMQMPLMGGVEATNRIRMREKAEGVPRLPIIALTAHAMQGDRERCLAAGMDDYLTKPIRAPELRTALERVCQSRSSLGASDQAKSVSDEEKVMDLSSLMAAFDSDETVLRQLCEVLVQEMPVMLERLDEVCAAGDWEAVKRSLHTLRGAISVFCPERALAAVAALDRAAQNVDVLAVGACQTRLRTELDRLLQALMSRTGIA